MAKTPLERYHDLKELYADKDSSFDWWERNAARPELGVYKIDTDHKKLSLRAYDDTPSTAIYERLTYVDFGGDGTAKDPIERIMEVTSMKFKEALSLILEWEGDIPEDFVPKETTGKKEELRSAYSNNYLREAILNKQKFKDLYGELAKGLFRSCSPEEQKEGEKLFSIGFVGKSEYQREDRIFIPEFDSGGIAWGSYSYNRGAERKGLLRKNSKRVIFGSHLLKKFGKNIIFSEGHTDTIVNVSKHMATVTTGSSTKKFGDNIGLLAGKHLHDFPDLDIAGMLGAVNRGLEIDEWNAANPDKPILHTIYWWSEWFVDQKIATKIQDNQVARSELFFNFKDSIPIKKEHACFNVDILAILQEEYAKKKKITLPDRLRIHTWKVMARGAKPAGYDWIDFHTDHSGSANYDSFIKQFKF
jgi:hypothetical protein